MGPEHRACIICPEDGLHSSFPVIAYLSGLPQRWLGLITQVRWQGHDADGRPILVIRLARACKECKSHRIATFAEAIVSQVGLSWRMLSPTNSASQGLSSQLSSCSGRMLSCITAAALLKRGLCSSPHCRKAVGKNSCRST